MKITDQFKEWAARLGAMEPGADPFVSCYLDLSPGFLTRFDSSARAAKKGLRPRQRRAVADALARVESFLKIDAGRGEGGVAIFSRAGVDPFFLTLPLDAPVCTICTIAPCPDTSGLLALTEQATPPGSKKWQRTLTGPDPRRRGMRMRRGDVKLTYAASSSRPHRVLA